jgi:plasmid stability protein
MANITIRSLDDSLKAKLRIRAAHHGRSMGAEAREILKAGLDAPPETASGLLQAIRSRFKPLGGVDLELPVRELPGIPPNFSE